MNKLIHYTLFSRLKFVTRFSGELMIQPERLESHILEMVGLAFDLHRKFKGDFDFDKLIYLILIHDLDESVTVDIPRPFKYHSEKFRLEFIENTKSYLNKLGLDKKLISDMTNAKESGLEGKILTLLDLFQVKLKMLTEKSLGNSNLDGNLSEVCEYLKKISKDKLIKKYLNYLEKSIA